MSFRLLLAGSTCLALALTAPAQAESLQQALAQVYATNPTLTGARAGLRATDENVAISRAQGLPDVSLNAAYNEFVKRSANNFTSPERSQSATATLTVPLYMGGSVANSVKAADARIDAGRADLRSTEANVFTQAVAAYLDVIRDSSIVELNTGNVRVLETNLQATRDRYTVGDLTRTDVAQSEARLAVARSQLQSAQAQLDGSRQSYLEVVGKFPDALETPPTLPGLPAAADEAVDIAITNNAALDSAKQASKAADYDIGTARASRLPTLKAFGTGNYTDYRGTLGGGRAQEDKTATIGLQATMPLYQGGEPAARVRQAQARKSQSLEQITAIERAVIADVRTAFSRYQASLAVIKSSETAVQANALALEGVRAENSVGTRNVLDVLNAEQELLNSKVTLVGAQRDAYVAGFSLLASIGRGEARYLGVEGGALYDPAANYKRVKGNLMDWGGDPAPTSVATRTVDVPVISAVTPSGK